MTKDEKTVAIIGLVWTFAACVLLAYLFHLIRQSIHKRDKRRELVKLQTEALLKDPRLSKTEKEYLAKDHCYLYPFSAQCKDFEVSWWRLHKYAIFAVAFGFLSAAIGIFLLKANPTIAAIMILLGILIAIFGGNILQELSKGSVYDTAEKKLNHFKDYFIPEMTIPEIEGILQIGKELGKKTFVSPEGIVIEV